MIGTVRADGFRVSLTGIGAQVPERVLTNDELSLTVDTSDEWIMERTGIRERRIAAPDEALSDLALPAARQALEQAGVFGKDIDLLIVATVTPDMAFPSTAAILADELGAADAGAYDLSAGCTGFMYALAQAYGMLAGGLAKRALVVGGDVLSRIIDWTDRRTCVLSAQEVLEATGRSVEDVDVYIPHQANVRIIEYARKKLGVTEDRTVVDVDRYGNTSSGSIPLALADAREEGMLHEGDLVLMTGMGAGLTWGSALMEWSLK